MHGRIPILDDRGVSVVVGAILVVGALVVTFSVVYLEYRRVASYHAEAAHMDKVLDEFITLKSRIQDLKLGKTDIVTVDIKMSPDPVPFLALSPSAAGLFSFEGTRGPLKVVFKMTSSADSYLYEDLTSVPSYTIQSGDCLEYDVFWLSPTDFIAFDFTCANGSTLRDSGAVDQNGIKAHPSADLSAYAHNRWYHRKIPIPPEFVDNVIENYDVACEFDNNDIKIAFLDDIVITDGAGKVRHVIYRCENFSHETHHVSNGELLEFKRSGCSPGTIVFDSNNHYFTNQDWVYEGGMVVLDQEGHDTMVASPSLIFAKDSTLENIEVYIEELNLVETSGSRSATGYLTLRIVKENSYSIYDNEHLDHFTYIILPRNKIAWHQYFTRERYRLGHENVMVRVAPIGAVCAWDFFEGGGDIAHDGSPNFYDAELVNDPTWVIAGKEGRAVKLDGVDDYMITPKLYDLLSPKNFPNESVTISVWFYATGPGVIVTELGQASIDTGWHNSQIEILDTGEVKVRVWKLDPVSLGTATFEEWHHVVLRYDNATQTLDGFLDGVEAASDVKGDRTAPWEEDYPLYYAFGAKDSTNLGDGSYFEGMIDEILIFDRALTAEEVSEIYRVLTPNGYAFTIQGKRVDDIPDIFLFYKVNELEASIGTGLT